MKINPVSLGMLLWLPVSAAFVPHQSTRPLTFRWSKEEYGVAKGRKRLAQSTQKSTASENEFDAAIVKLKSLPKLERQVASKMLDEEAGEMVKELTATMDNNNWSDYVEIMNEWARLGRAEEANAFFAKVTQSATSMPSTVHMAFLRSLLHAWSNRLQLVKKSPIASETAAEAARTLEKMIELSSDDTSALDPADFSRVITNYLDLTPCRLTAILDTWNIWRAQANVSTPPAQLGVKVIRSVANQNSTSWDEAMETTDTAMKLGRIILDSSIATAQPNGDSSHGDDNEEEAVQIYNSLLEVVSKVLPPPSRQKSYDKFVVGDKERNHIGERTKALVSDMEAAEIKPSMQTYTTILYAYCECGWLEEAWEIWEAWKLAMIRTDLESDGDQNPPVDSRSLRMLIQSSLVQAEEASDVQPDGELSPLQYAQRATDAIKDMWVLYDQGFSEMKPDTDLYTFLLHCWSSPQFKSVSMNSARGLVDDLIERYQATSDPSVQPHRNFYSAWQNVVRSHFGDTSVSAAEEAGAIINEMERQSIFDPSVAPDTSFYNFLIDACLSDKQILGVQRAEQTLEKMLQLPSSSTKAPNGRSFSSVVRAYLRFDTALAERWLDRMEERFTPPSDLFEAVVIGCCRETKAQDSAGKKQAERARRLLNRMEELSKVTSNAQLRPAISLYSAVAAALEISGLETLDASLKPSIGTMEGTKSDRNRKNKIVSRDDIFKLMKEMGMVTAGEDDLVEEADTLTFNRAIAKLANTGKANAGVLAEEIFNYMLDQYINNANVKVEPNLITFNSVILAWAKCGHRNAAVRADGFFGNLRNLQIGGMLLDIEPDVISYNTLIAAYQRSGQANAGEEAERVFKELESAYEATKDKRYRPDVVSICSLLGAYANRGDSGRSEELLLHFWKEHKEHQDQVAPDTTCFDQVLRAWAKTGKAGRAHMLLELMEDLAQTPESPVKPTTVTYNIVLHALAQSGELGASGKALELLDKMKTSRRTSPDTVTYTTAIAVTSRLGGRHTLKTIESLLEEAWNTPDVKVDTTFFANVLSSLALCGDSQAISFAQDLVEKKMPGLGVEPGIFVWNALLNCFAKRGLGDEADEILQQLETGALVAVPNVRTYSVVLDAHAKSSSSSSIEKAEALIQKMEESNLKPDAKAYTALIQKYARSSLPMKAKHAKAVLQTMNERVQDGCPEARPTVVTYNALLNACEYTTSTDLQEKEEAFTVAVFAFDEVQKLPGLSPSHATYGSFLGVVARLMPRSEARNEIAELVFKRCCKEGQVSQYVLRKLKVAVSLSQYRQMLGGRREDKLPRKWAVNVRQRRNDGIGRRKNRNKKRTGVFATN